MVLQSPNFFGVIEDQEVHEHIIHGKNALFISVFTEPVAFGMIKPPGDFNADIVCGEGQSLGIPPGYGGPLLGILTSKNQFVRNMPGRIVGEAVDKNGARSFVLTLAAREQHIRRVGGCIPCGKRQQEGGYFGGTARFGCQEGFRIG